MADARGWNRKRFYRKDAETELEAPSARHICRIISQQMFSSDMSGIFRPDGAGDLIGFGWYKDSAPTELSVLSAMYEREAMPSADWRILTRTCTIQFRVRIIISDHGAVVQENITINKILK